MTQTKMPKSDQLLIQRVAQGDVSFRYEACPSHGSHAKLVGSTISPSQQKHLHRLALVGYLSEHVEAHASAKAHLPGTTVRFTITALGRQAIGLHAEPPPPTHRHMPLSEAELLAEGIE